MFKLTMEDARVALEKAQTDFARLLERDGFDIGLYKPDRIDRQGAHVRDEIYVVASGSGYFEHDGQTEPVRPGDVLFVPAREVHRFKDFSEDFSAWVVFIGRRPLAAP